MGPALLEAANLLERAGLDSGAIILLCDGGDGVEVASNVPEPSGLHQDRISFITSSLPQRAAHLLNVILYAVSEGYSIHCLGFGENHDDSLLGGVAAAAGGTYAFVADTEHAEGSSDVFLNIVRLTGSLVSHGATLTLELPHESDASAISAVDAGAYPVRLEENGRRAVINFGALAAGEQRDILCTLCIPPSSTPRGAEADLHSQRGGSLLSATVDMPPAGRLEKSSPPWPCAISAAAWGGCVRVAWRWMKCARRARPRAPSLAW